MSQKNINILKRAIILLFCIILLFAGISKLIRNNTVTLYDIAQKNEQTTQN